MIKYHILGMISGSSLDGVDMAACTFIFERTKDQSLKLVNWNIENADTAPFENDWYNRLKNADTATTKELLELNTSFGAYLGQLAKHFLIKNNFPADYIASHGHTVHHYPERGYTCQIGAGATISANSRLPVINSFRDMDMAMGGQGAPVAPIADAWLFDKGFTFFLNLGGIANISCRTPLGFIAFDITGCNQILNALINTVDQPYDQNGQLAAQGKLNPELFNIASKWDFLQTAYPKSLDNNQVKTNQTQFFLAYDAPLSDKLHTASQLIGHTIAQSIQRIIYDEKLNSSSYKLLATGGGAFNCFLLKCIQEHCKKLNVHIEIPEKKLIEFKEAAMIALMGALRLESIPNVMASVTGAEADSINGAIHLV